MMPIVVRLLKRCGVYPMEEKEAIKPCHLVLKDFYVSSVKQQEAMTPSVDISKIVENFIRQRRSYVRGTLSLNDGIQSVDLSFEAGEIDFYDESKTDLILEDIKQSVDQFSLK